MKQPLKLVHASDVHLDTDYYGGTENLSLRDYHRGIFASLLQRARDEQPQLMLLPGDLFDSNRASEATILWAMEQLGALPFPVLMIPGNHDCLEEGAIFHRYDFAGIPNVELLQAAEGEQHELPALGAAVWGKGMVEHSTEFRPLDGLPAARPDRWNLAMGHGIYVGREGFSFRSSPVEARQIARSGYDYIALGHHHALLDVSADATAAYYSGAPVPISPDRAGTYLVVEFREGESTQVHVRHLD
jgi:DNA repair exonuclease SbcCD nuclease subunit